MFVHSKNCYQTYFKRTADLILAGAGTIFLLPIFSVIGLFIKIDSVGPIIFRQKRVGKDGKVFTIYKFRTMVENAERLKTKVLYLNEADGPVFKIRNDPRFTKIGRFLSHTGLDELPQIFNILMGGMSIVGPRPLPVDEESKISPKEQKQRRGVKPGLVSSWVLKGAHDLTFKEWLASDMEDIDRTSFGYDLKILISSVLLAKKLVVRELLGINSYRV